MEGVVRLRPSHMVERKEVPHSGDVTGRTDDTTRRAEGGVIGIRSARDLSSIENALLHHGTVRRRVQRIELSLLSLSLSICLVITIDLPRSDGRTLADRGSDGANQD